jgi:hypothetical protein
LDGLVQNCRKIIKDKNKKLECFAVYEGQEITL